MLDCAVVGGCLLMAGEKNKKWQGPVHLYVYSFSTWIFSQHISNIVSFLLHKRTCLFGNTMKQINYWKHMIKLKVLQLRIPAGRVMRWATAAVCFQKNKRRKTKQKFISVQDFECLGFVVPLLSILLLSAFIVNFRIKIELWNSKEWHSWHDAFQSSPYNESSTVATIHEVEFGFESIKLSMDCQAVLNLFKTHGFKQIEKVIEYNAAHRCQSTKYLLKYENRLTSDKLGAWSCVYLNCVFWWNESIVLFVLNCSHEICSFIAIQFMLYSLCGVHWCSGWHSPFFESNVVSVEEKIIALCVIGLSVHDVLWIVINEFCW